MPAWLQSTAAYLWIKFSTGRNSFNKIKMAKIRITQTKSRIGSTARQKRTLDALGLRKMHKRVEMETSPQILGMVNKVRHLVKVEEL